MSFLDFNIICEKSNFTTSVYHKPTFSRIYTYFDLVSYLLVTTLARYIQYYIRICSDWTKFHLDLVKFSRITVILTTLLIIVFKCFWITNIEYKKSDNSAEKNLFLVLPFLGPLSLQTRTKLRKHLKTIFNCYKLQIAFESQNKISKGFSF